MTTHKEHSQHPPLEKKKTQLCFLLLPNTYVLVSLSPYDSLFTTHLLKQYISLQEYTSQQFTNVLV